MSITLDSRLSLTARALARLWAENALTPDQLRQQMRPALANAHTVAMLAGTGGQRSAEIDRALRQIIEAEYAELDRLIALLESQPDADIERRLLAFADALDETRADGETLARRDEVSPLVPAAIGGALGALLERIISQPGRVVIPRLDSRSMQGITADLQRRMDELSDLYTNGELLLDDWHIRMQRLITEAHTRYSFQQGALTSAERQRLEERIRREFGFLERFRADIEAGKMTPAQIKARSQMYLESAQITLQESMMTALGIPAMPATPRDWTSICKNGCMCTWAFERLEGNGNWNARWLLRPAEHCQTCLNRAALWNPIEIRNGVLGPYSRIGTFA